MLTLVRLRSIGVFMNPKERASLLSNMARTRSSVNLGFLVHDVLVVAVLCIRVVRIGVLKGLGSCRRKFRWPCAWERYSYVG